MNYKKLTSFRRVTADLYQSGHADDAEALWHVDGLMEALAHCPDRDMTRDARLVARVLRRVARRWFNGIPREVKP